MILYERFSCVGVAVVYEGEILCVCVCVCDTLVLYILCFSCSTNDHLVYGRESLKDERESVGVSERQRDWDGN